MAPPSLPIIFQCKGGLWLTEQAPFALGGLVSPTVPHPHTELCPASMPLSMLFANVSESFLARSPSKSANPFGTV